MEENSPFRKKTFKTKYGKIGLILFIVVASSILFYFSFFKDRTLFGFLRHIVSTLKPFILGAVLAYILKPICVVFEKWVSKWFVKMKNRSRAANLTVSVSITFTLILFVALLYLLFYAIIPQVIDSIKVLIDTLPDTYDNAMSWALSASKGTPMEQPIIDFNNNTSEYVQKIITKDLSIDASTILSSVTVGVKGLLKFLENLIVGLVACVYILAQRKTLAKQGTMIVNSVFNDKWAKEVMSELKYIDKMFSGFINGKIIDSIIIGLLTFVVTSIFKIPYPVLISVIVGVTNIIPFFGPWIGAVPCALIIIMVSPVKCLTFIIIIIAIQQLDGNIIGPKILGNTTGLSSFWVLFSIVVFGGLFGFAGLIVGVPVFAVLYDIIKRLVKAGLMKRNKEELYIEYINEKASLAEEKAEVKEQRAKRFKKVRFNKR